MYDGSFVCNVTGNPKLVTIAPPIQIFHPVFQEFLDDINNPKFKPEEDVVAKVSHMMTLSSRIYSSEDAALSEIRRSLNELLGGRMEQVISRKSRNSDGVIFKHGENSDIPLILHEYKRAIGEGGCDPSVQAARSLREFLIKDEVCAFRTFSVTPLGS
jgi:hypothetical protein